VNVQQGLDGNPDRLRWNARYGGSYEASFSPHPLAERALQLAPAGGPVLDLACGASGSVLLAAAMGRRVMAVDVSEVALGLLRAEAERRGTAGLITLVHADLTAWQPLPGGYALVLATSYWDRAVFAAAATAVSPGGLIAWEALTADARLARPGLCADWCLAAGEPATVLPAGFTVLDQHDLPGNTRRRLLAQRDTPTP
jgi:SAM-dependent methyltransferase